MVIVFGAGGFIGTYLIDQLLTEGFDILATDINQIAETYYKERRIPFVLLDITRKEEFDRLPSEGVDSVVHLACLQPTNTSKEQYDPMSYIKVNVIGTLNILKFCQKTGIRKAIYTTSHREVECLWKPGRAIREDAARAIKYTGEYAMYVNKVAL